MRNQTNPQNETEIDPLDAFMDNLYNENKDIIQENNLHLIKSQADYREELKEQYLTQHETFEQTRKELTLPESKGPASNKVVKKLSGTMFVKGERLFGKVEEISGRKEEYVLGSDAKDFNDVEEVKKSAKNKWDVNRMFKEYFTKRTLEIVRYVFSMSFLYV
jgi:hypothetical protein